MELTIDSIRTLANENRLKDTLKYDDSFVVSGSLKDEVETLLKEAEIGYQGITQDSNNIMYIIQPYGDQG
ncbi:hypothetical protein [Cytophaga aurantiaca]|uniref:hypothetical protein n=1 Tax=Cytophaga aurantiaca TaxID=29530 RepID=UPI0003661866|nr:hypothetical protein [Cytophaga aurantiaca]